MLAQTSSFTQARQDKAARLLEDGGAVVLVSAGSPIGIPGGQDQVYPFVAHPDYFWLSGCERPGGVMAFSPSQGWVDFRVPVSSAERVWEGIDPALTAASRDLGELESWLEQQGGLPVYHLGAAGQPIHPELERKLQHLRRSKDEHELGLVGKAVEATRRGFARLPEWIRPGVSEREVGIRLESEFFLGGAQRTGYGTIVGAGRHSAILHWPPTDAVLQAGQLVLIDAGASVDGYTADVTRVYPVSGQWNARQAELYAMLLQAQQAAVAMCRPGVEWSEIHLATARALADGLRHLGVLRVGADEALDSEAIGLFFPHGLGHMFGLGVRDASGLGPGRTEVRSYAGARLRMDLPLQESYLVTVEPGVYFIPALLDDPEQRRRHADRIAWDALEPWFELGGMRIEDDVLVSARGPVNLTESIPK